MCGSARPAQAGEVVEHGLDAVLHLGTASARDDTLVPLAFTGPAGALGARYSLLADRHGLEADLGFGFGLLANRFEQAGGQLAHSLGVGYAYMLERGSSEVLGLGGMLRERTDVSVFMSWDDAHAYWLATLGVAPTLHYARRLGSSVWLETRGELALVGLYSRPPDYRRNKQDALNHLGYYFDRIGQSPRWFSPLDVQALQLQALARFRRTSSQLGSGFALGLLVQLLRASEPRPYTVLETSLVLAHGWEL